MDIMNYANLIGVKVFRPGTHTPATEENPVMFGEERVARMLENTIAAQPLIRKSIETNEYAGNGQIATNGFVPGVMNIAHNRWLPNDFKQMTKDVSASYRREGEWIVADFANVPDEIAIFLKELLPGRSVEIIPALRDPDTGQVYSDVIRSVGFLPNGQRIDPAVADLTQPDFAVAFQSHGIQTYITTTTQQQGEPTMEKKDEKVEQRPPEVSIQDFEALKAKADADRKEAEHQLQLMQAQIKEQQDIIAHERREREIASVQAYCKDMITKGYAPAIFDADFRSALLAADNQTVMEFSEGRKASSRAYWQQKIDSILEMQSVKVPEGEAAPDVVGKAERSLEQRQAAMIAEYEAKGLSYNDAYKQAVMEHKELWD